MRNRRFFSNLYRYRNKESLTIREIIQILIKDPEAILIDVRSTQEYNEGHLQRSINIPLYDLEKYLDIKIKNKEAIIILYCQSGMRSKQALEILKQKGYKNVYNLEGGLNNI